jgi:hypothetical protein
VPTWLALTGAAAVALCAVYLVRATRVHNPPLAAASETPHERDPSLPTPSARAELVYASGEVTVGGTSGGIGRTLLAEGTSIETANGSACVLIDADINVCLAAHSRMRLSAIATAARKIDLESGTLATRLATQPEGMSLSIIAGGVSSTAIGTAFSVEVTNDHVVTTTVLNGKVKVGHAGGDAPIAMVRAHERALSETRVPVAPQVSSVGRKDESPSWALLGPTVLWHDPVAATLDVRGEPSAAEVWLDEQWVGVTPLSTLLPVGEHRLAVRKAGKELESRELRLHAGESIEVDYESLQPTAAAAVHAAKPLPSKHASLSTRVHGHDALAEADATDEAKAAELPSGAELLRRARQAVRSGRFTDAAQSYESAIDNYAGSDEGQTALVLLGQLRLTQLNDPHGALSVLNTYLHTGGSLEVEASIARIEALHTLRRSSEEAAAIDDFLRRHPRSFEAKALRARLHAPSN